MTRPVAPPNLPPDLAYLLATYCIGRKLGGGSFGTVRAASHIKTNEAVAIKIISRARMQEEKGAEDKVRREINIMRLLRHPHIVRLYEVIETERDIYLVMEYVAAGELFDFLNVRGRLHEASARRFFQQLITGIEACHAAGVVHRDLKPENLLLTADGDSDSAALKIADFGLSNVLRDGHFLHTSCGSPNYAAPEVIAGRQYAGPEVDVWSAGCILFALLAGRLPFDDGNVGRLFRAIKAGAFTLPTHLSGSARDLLRRMLTVDPLKRITIEEIRQHPWFTPGLPGYLAMPMPALGLHGLPPLPDPVILQQLSTLDIDAQAAAKAVQRRQHSPPAVAYHLLFDAAQRRVGGPLVQPQPPSTGLPSVTPPLQRVSGGGRWLPGLPLRLAGGASAVVAAMVSALAAHGCAWKRTALYTYRCRAAPGSAFAGRLRSGKAAAAQQHAGGSAAVIKFEVQVYIVAEATYLVDVQRLQGSLPCYLDLCSALLSHVAALAAGHHPPQQASQHLQQTSQEQQQQQQQQQQQAQLASPPLPQHQHHEHSQDVHSQHLQHQQHVQHQHVEHQPAAQHQQAQHQQHLQHQQALHDYSNHPHPQHNLLEQQRLQQAAAAAALPQLEAAFAHFPKSLPNGLPNGLPHAELPDGMSISSGHGGIGNGAAGSMHSGGHLVAGDGMHNGVVTSGDTRYSGPRPNGLQNGHSPAHGRSASGRAPVTSGGGHGVASAMHLDAPAASAAGCGGSAYTMAGYGATGYAFANGHMHG